MNSTDVTQKDIDLWKKRLKEGQKAINNGNETEIKNALANTINDMAFLVIFAESLLKIEVDQSVYDKAREAQYDLRHLGEREKE